MVAFAPGAATWACAPGCSGAAPPAQCGCARSHWRPTKHERPSLRQCPPVAQSRLIAAGHRVERQHSIARNRDQDAIRASDHRADGPGLRRAYRGGAYHHTYRDGQAATHRDDYAKAIAHHNADTIGDHDTYPAGDQHTIAYPVAHTVGDRDAYPVAHTIGDRDAITDTLTDQHSIAYPITDQHTITDTITHHNAYPVGDQYTLTHATAQTVADCHPEPQRDADHHADDGHGDTRNIARTLGDDRIGRGAGARSALC